ncbi:MAG: phenylpyruvate tautomerase MIF-related protein [Clostridium sp.]
MPYIDSSVSCKLTCEKKEKLKSKLGKAIEILPGKTEEWLFIRLRDSETLYFQGKELDNGAVIEVKMIGCKSPSDKEALTQKICSIYNKYLGIDPKNIYIIFTEAASENWGWNNELFDL